MSVFIVTATHTDDDYKRPHSSSETAMATSREDAVIRAVEFYLDRLDDGYAFDCHSPSGFSKVIEQHRNSPQTLFSALHDYFESNPEGMFTGALDIGGKSRKKIRKSFEEGSTADITKTFSQEYERPSKPHMDRRLKSAEDFDKFKGLFTNPSGFL